MGFSALGAVLFMNAWQPSRLYTSHFLKDLSIVRGEYMLLGNTTAHMQIQSVKAPDEYATTISYLECEPEGAVQSSSGAGFSGCRVGRIYF